MTWMQTRKGRRWDLLNPRASDVDFDEIAHSLSVLPRFLGHTIGTNPYSVAEHCVHVHDLLLAVGSQPWVCFWGLLHDAHEAYIGDFTAPVKSALVVAAEELGQAGDGRIVAQALKGLAMIQDVPIFDAAGLTDLRKNQHPKNVTAARNLVKWADTHLLAAERNARMSTPPEPWPVDVEVSEPHASITVGDWTAEEAREAWLMRFRAHQDIKAQEAVA